MKQQLLHDAMWDIWKFELTSNVICFIMDLNKVQIKPEFMNNPQMGNGFVKTSKQLLNESILQKMEDSQQDIFTYEQLKF